MDGNAIILSGGILDDLHAKTTHGLIRGTTRYRIVGVIDHKFAGQDAGEVVDGKRRNIPIFKNIDDFLENSDQPAEYCIIGVATAGGVIPDAMKEVLKDAIINGFSIVNGLHQHLSSFPDLVGLAREAGVRLIDIRKPRPNSELSFWSGDIYKVLCPIIAVMGTDCAVGKRTASFMLIDALNAEGIHTEMIYTGQTGWLCGIKHGFIFDATVNDFISGELEKALVSCYQDTKPEAILIEGQSSLRNPSGPCGSEFILSGNAKGIVLVHPPLRKKYQGFEEIEDDIPALSDEIRLISMYGAKTLGIILNTMGVSESDVLQARSDIEKETGLPVAIPLLDGVHEVLPGLVNYIRNYRK